MKNIAVALNAGLPAQRNSITRFFASQNWVYWHWVDDFWIVQVPDNYSPKILHDQIETLGDVGKPTMLVFEFQGSIKYWGRGDKEAWQWLSHIGSVG